VTLLAHCGANWPYCDGASIAGGLFMLWLIRRSVKRAERRARRRAADRFVANAVRDVEAQHLAQKHEEQEDRRNG
jgi:hypothetical protein